MKKNILFVCLSFFCINAFAGGQLGSGGNGCWVAESKGLSWKSIEELQYPDFFIENKYQFKKDVLPEVAGNTFVKANLSNERSLQKAMLRLERIKDISPHLYKTLLNISSMFKVSYIVKSAPEGIFDGAIFYGLNCVSFAPALMTLENGSIVFFSETWNKLDGVSAEVILVHEILRMAQLFHPAFAEMDDAELQLITALFFSPEIYRGILKSKIMNLEKKVHRSCLNDFLPTSDDSFKSKLHASTCSGGKELDHFNSWRSLNPLHRQNVERDIADLFFED